MPSDKSLLGNKMPDPFRYLMQSGINYKKIRIALSFPTLHWFYINNIFWGYFNIIF